MPITILDGPMGSQLSARAIATPLPGWSAHALETAPGTVSAIHRDYAAARASVHTANTFRTRRRTFPDRWEELARRAVKLCRDAVPRAHLVAGSLAPVEDCYRPDLSPGRAARAEHRELARVLADAGCDLLLCETFPHIPEALVALEEALDTDLPVWVSFTAGPAADLLSPAEMARGARLAARAGAAAVLVNCTPAPRTLEFVARLGDAGIPFGAYANLLPFRHDTASGLSPAPYADLAAAWADAGATVLGACCGAGPAHISALARRFTPCSSSPSPAEMK